MDHTVKYKIITIMQFVYLTALFCLFSPNVYNMWGEYLYDGVGAFVERFIDFRGYLYAHYGVAELNQVGVAQIALGELTGGLSGLVLLISFIYKAVRGRTSCLLEVISHKLASGMSGDNEFVKNDIITLILRVLVLSMLIYFIIIFAIVGDYIISFFASLIGVVMANFQFVFHAIRCAYGKKYITCNKFCKFPEFFHAYNAVMNACVLFLVVIGIYIFIPTKFNYGIFSDAYAASILSVSSFLFFKSIQWCCSIWILMKGVRQNSMP